MRTTITALAAAAALTPLALNPAAAAPQQASSVFIYSSYFHCGGGMGGQADEALTKLYKAVYDAGVAEGTIASWGYLAHHTGGEWKRVVYTTASSLKVLMAAQDKLDSRTNTKDNKENARLDKSFNQACSSHEDYVWHGVAGNDAQGRRGKAAFSVYYVCDGSRETQADALIKRVFAPMYDKLVADGKLTSWGWFEHIVGGKYRRLATMTASDMDALMDARASIVQALQNDPLGEDLNSICGSHQDYLWDVKFQAP
jgi:hypothetical protein